MCRSTSTVCTLSQFSVPFIHTGRCLGPRRSYLDVHRLLLDQPGMVSQNPGKGAMYVIGFTDSDGASLDGDQQLSLASAGQHPRRQFLVGDALRGGECFGSRQRPAVPLARFARQARAERRWQHGPLSGPKAPQGKDGNWLATVPGRGYFAILRLYGPTEAALNKSWKPGDIENWK